MRQRPRSLSGRATGSLRWRTSSTESARRSSMWFPIDVAIRQLSRTITTERPSARGCCSPIANQLGGTSCESLVCAGGTRMESTNKTARRLRADVVVCLEQPDRLSFRPCAFGFRAHVCSLRLNAMRSESSPPVVCPDCRAADPREQQGAERDLVVHLPRVCPRLVRNRSVTCRSRGPEPGEVKGGAGRLDSVPVSTGLWVSRSCDKGHP